MGKAKSKTSSKDARAVAQQLKTLRNLAASHRKLEEAARKTGAAAAKKALAFVRKHSDKFFKFGITKVGGWYNRGKLYGGRNHGGIIENALFHPKEVSNHAGYRMTKIGAPLVGRRAGNAAETIAHMLGRTQADNVFSGGKATSHHAWTDEDRLQLYAVESAIEVKSLDHAAALVNSSMRSRGIDGICVRDSRVNDLVILDDSSVAFDEFTCAVRKKFGEPAVLQMMAEVLDAQSSSVTIEWMTKTSKALLNKYTKLKSEKRANRTKITYRKPLQPFAADNFRRQWLSYVEAYFGAGDDDA